MKRRDLERHLRSHGARAEIAAQRDVLGVREGEVLDDFAAARARR